MTLTRAKVEQIEAILRRTDAPTFEKIGAMVGATRCQVAHIRAKLEMPPRRHGHPPHLVQAEVADIVCEMYRATDGFARTARQGVVPMLAQKYGVHRNVINRIAYATPGIGEKYKLWREEELGLIRRAQRRLVLRAAALALPPQDAPTSPPSGPSASP